MRTMRPRVRAGVAVTALSVAAAFLTVCVPGVGSAHAAGSTSAAPKSDWAYGAIRTIAPHGQGVRYGYEATATLGFADILDQTSGSAGSFNITDNRTMGLLLSVTYCAPTCRHPTATLTLTYHAWESLHGEVNLTSTASVDLLGTPTAAVGLVSSYLNVNVGARAAVTWTDAGKVVGARSLQVAVEGNSSTIFTPALGLVPLTVAAGDTWSATAAFVEAGAASWNVFDGGVGRLVPHAGNVTANGTLPFVRTGTVSVEGAYANTIRLAGAEFDALNLTLSGPFLLREGFLFVPASSDLFGASPPPWLSNTSGNATGSAAVSQSSIDVSPGVVGGSHLGFAASEMLWQTGATNPATFALLSPAAAFGPAAPAAAPAATAANTTYVQGSPESVTQASTDQGCLARDVGCPLASPRHGILGLVVVVAAAATVAVLLAVVVAERRRLPPPVYPNAALYPPGLAGTASPAGGRRPDRPNAPADDDPLRHLW